MICRELICIQHLVETCFLYHDIKIKKLSLKTKITNKTVSKVSAENRGSGEKGKSLIGRMFGADKCSLYILAWNEWVKKWWKMRLEIMMQWAYVFTSFPFPSHSHPMTDLIHIPMGIPVFPIPMYISSVQQSTCILEQPKMGQKMCFGNICINFAVRMEILNIFHYFFCKNTWYSFASLKFQGEEKNHLKVEILYNVMQRPVGHDQWAYSTGLLR